MTRVHKTQSFLKGSEANRVALSDIKAICMKARERGFDVVIRDVKMRSVVHSPRRYFGLIHFDLIPNGRPDKSVRMTYPSHKNDKSSIFYEG